MMKFVESEEHSRREDVLREVIVDIPIVVAIALLVQLSSIASARADWQTILNCAPELHRAQIGNQTLIPDVQETFPPPTVTVKCLSRDDGTLFDQEQLPCPATENESISVRWHNSKVDGRCNPRKAATTDGTATQGSTEVSQ